MLILCVVGLLLLKLRYELCRILQFITLVLHHRGSIERDENRKLKYVDGEIGVMVKKVGVTQHVKLFT
jgi:hypothetical protein